MSFRKDKLHALLDQRSSQSENLRDAFKEHLEKGIHGIAFSAYEEGQEPGDQITEEQIRRRMQILEPNVKSMLIELLLKVVIMVILQDLLSMLLYSFTDSLVYCS